MASDLLEAIVAATRHTVQVRERCQPASLLEARISRRPRGDRFARALRSSPEPRIIAECKKRSPSKGLLRSAYDPVAHAVAYAKAGAAAVSVLTEPMFFDGSPEHLAQVRTAVDLPLLRKDFIVTEYQLVEAVALGADAALLIVGALDDEALGRLLARASALGLAALVEVHSRGELDRALGAGAAIVGVNSRNLRTLEVVPDVFESLIGGIPANVTAVAESGIRDRGDLGRLSRAGYHAFLIGERLIARPDPGAALEELRRG